MENKEKWFFKLFIEVCKSINSSLEIQEVLKMISRQVPQVLNVKACAILLLNKVDKKLEVGASYGLSEAYLNKGPVDAEKSIVDSLRGKTVLVCDAKHDDRIQYPEEAEREHIASILSVPIQVRGNVIGVLRLYTEQVLEFSQDEIEFVWALAEMGGIAIENARLYDHLKTDYEKLMNDVHQWFDYGSM